MKRVGLTEHRKSEAALGKTSRLEMSAKALERKSRPEPRGNLVEHILFLLRYQRTYHVVLLRNTRWDSHSTPYNS